jgi:transport and Golgi organization protein 2
METGLRNWRKEQGEPSCTVFDDRALAELATIFSRCAILPAGGLMCTISFLPNTHGFYLAMNRDEKLDRFAALPPTIVDLESCRAVFPSEPTGGTWISANDAGVCLALINWHRVERKPKNDVVSRGEVVRALAGKSDADDIADGVAKLPLRKLRPFRLIAIVPWEKLVTEWRWDLECLTVRDHKWGPQHWFSSGFDERRAELERQRICDAAHTHQSTKKLNWLRQLHRSHAPKRGPFSICMHRRDASTVSYTEVAVSEKRAKMRYKAGPCCTSEAIVTKMISLARSL